MEYLVQTMRAYDRKHAEYAEANKGFAETHLVPVIKRFLEAIPGRRVLDIGSGDAEIARMFKEYGFEPVCVDLSKRMVERARMKGLEAYQMDFGMLGFPDQHFAGVWANMSLLHTPKYRMPFLLYEAWRVLQDKGKLFLSLKEGSGEGWYTEGSLAPAQRYVAYYKQNEVKDILERNGLPVIFSSRLSLRDKEPMLLFIAERN